LPALLAALSLMLTIAGIQPGVQVAEIRHASATEDFQRPPELAASQSGSPTPVAAASDSTPSTAEVYNLTQQ